MVTDYDKHVIGEYNFQKGIEKGIVIGRNDTINEMVAAGLISKEAAEEFMHRNSK